MPEAGTAGRTNEERDDHIFQHLLTRLPVRGKVLVLIGFSHVPEQASRLMTAGFGEAELSASRKAELFALSDAPFTYPPGMIAAIRQRVDDAEAQAAATPGPFAIQLRELAAPGRATLQEIEGVGEAPSYDHPSGTPDH